MAGRRRVWAGWSPCRPDALPARRHTVLVAIAVLAAMLPRLAAAQVASDRFSSIVVDAGSGKVLEESSADVLRYPASLTKMMTLYLVFEALRDRRITLDTLVPVSAEAAAKEPSKLGLLPGSSITVEQGVLALVTKSANDAAAALGEFLGGSEGRFGEMMTLRARALGMTHTVFRNASGLPDPYQVTTARDVAILARHLIRDFPEDYHYFSTPSFVFHGRTIYNHDLMLRTYAGADGMKTGYTEEAGHNLVTSALHGDVRLIGVVLGATSNVQRSVQMTAMLNQGFEQEGAPVYLAKAEAPARAPLFATAHAATLPHHATVRLATAQVRRRVVTHTPVEVAEAPAHAPTRVTHRRVAHHYVHPVAHHSQSATTATACKRYHHCHGQLASR